MATLVSLMICSCDDNKDEPVTPVAQQLESEHGEANDTYLIYDIDMDKDSSTIYVYNVVFTMGDVSSKPLSISINAPCSVDKSGKVFSFAGTDIVPNLLRGTTPVPITSLRVNNFTSSVNVEKKTYSISFDCQGTVIGKTIDGHYDKQGNLK